jgi:excisionase family DNA binding protein
VEKMFLSVRDTSEALSIGRTKIYGLIKEGRLATVKVGRRRLIKMSSIRAIADRA